MRCKKKQSGFSCWNSLVRRSLLNQHHSADEHQIHMPTFRVKRRSSLILLAQYESRSFNHRRFFSDTRWYQRISKSKSKKKDRISSFSPSPKKSVSPKLISKPTSWTFVSANTNNTNFGNQNPFEFGVYSRSKYRKKKKQQAFSILPTSALPYAPSLRFETERKANSLNQLLLDKRNLLKRRHFKTEIGLTLSGNNKFTSAVSRYSVNKPLA